MSALELWPDHSQQPKLDLTEWKNSYALNDADIEWWAVALLDPDGLTYNQARVRHSMLQGRQTNLSSQLFWICWAEVVIKARTVICKHSLDEWIERAWNDYDHESDKAGKECQAIQDAALCSVRSFVQFAGLADDDGKPMVMKGFHVRTLNSLRRNRQTVALLPYEHGKQVTHRTTVWTPLGRRKHGDLRPGDEVFGPDGKPTKVVAISPDSMATKRVTFSDGESIDCHSKHLWRVFERGRNEWRVMETQEMSARKYMSTGRPLFQVQYPEPLDPPEIELPMDPYSLGVWLGDGTKGKPGITHHPEDQYDLPYSVQRTDVHKTTGIHFTAYSGMATSLKEAGVMNEKHIPEIYQRASKRQRWDLLSGLIDTDGCISPKSGQVRFINANKDLIDEVIQLVRSFGLRPSVTFAEPTMSSSGIQGKQRIYYVGFYPRDLGYPSRLVRKTGLWEIDEKIRKRHRGIVKIEEIEPTPGRCIQVERSDGMYLVGESLIPTHNSVIASLVIPMMDWCEWRDCSQIRVYLDDDTRAKAVSRLKQQVEFNENLQKLFPWFRRPRKGDKSTVWNQRSFSIGGRTIGDAGFRAFTIKAGRIGHRANRVIYDDIVTSTEAESHNVQQRNYDYILAAGQTTPQTSTHFSKHLTSFTTFGIVGTLFSPIDANSRCWEHFEKQEKMGRKGYKTLRFDIYPRGEANANIVLWPEWRDAEAVYDMKLRLGPRIFMMRCRNRLQHEGLVTFPEDKVMEAMHDGESGRPYLAYGQLPPNCDILIGFDPAKGTTSKWAKNPAIVLYGLRNLADMTPYGPFVSSDRPQGPQPVWQHYIIKWKRLYGYDFTRQIGEIISWAEEYRCPVAIENNNQQIHYWDYLKQLAPHVQVVDHHTGLNKRNPDQGVDTFAPLFYTNKVAICAGDAPLDEVDALRKELIQWKSGPTPRGEFSDLVMATWIARYQLETAVFNVVREQRAAMQGPPRVRQVANTMWRGPVIPFGRGMRHNPYRG